VSTVPLPSDPSLEKLRIQARRLQRSVRGQDAQALELVAELDPSGAPAQAARFPLSAAQLVIARRHGFANRPALTRHLDVVEHHSWNPDPPDGGADESLACPLFYLAYSRLPAEPVLALAALLLDAGANPNDGQALYNRMFEPDNDHLAVLLEYGLGAGDGGPWKARPGDELAPPAELLRGELDWAVAHDQLARVRLLVEAGVEVAGADDDDHTPVKVAGLCGNAEIVDHLLAAGAPAPVFDALDKLIAAAMTGAREARPETADLGQPLRRASISAARSSTKPPGLATWLRWTTDSRSS
jgi:hypothetical protein